MRLHITDSRLLGGLDLAATLRAGRPVAERRLLADSDGALLLTDGRGNIARDGATGRA